MQSGLYTTIGDSLHDSLFGQSSRGSGEDDRVQQAAEEEEDVEANNTPQTVN